MVSPPITWIISLYLLFRLIFSQTHWLLPACNHMQASWSLPSTTVSSSQVIMPHSVVFFKTYPANPRPSTVCNPYKPRHTQPRPKGKWLGLTQLTCRNFSKDTYEYRDLHYSLGDQGWRYPVPSCLQGVYQCGGEELRKTDLGPRKWRNEGRSVQSKMRASSTAMMTLSEVEAPVPQAPACQARPKAGETEYQRSFQRH